MGEDILVLGAGGFIGTRVVAALEERRPGSVRAGFNRPSHKTGVHCDLLDPDSLRAAMRDVYAVVNCARSPWGLENARASARNLCSAAASSGVRKMIHLSSIAVYGSAQGDVHEETSSLSALSGYAAEKRSTEEILRQASSIELNVVVLRPGLVYGHGGVEWFDYFIAGKRLAHLRDLGRMGSGEANLVHVDDLARFCAELVHQPVPEFVIANVVGNDVPTFNRYFAILTAAAGAPPPPPRVMGRRLWETRRLARKVARRLAGFAPIPAIRDLVPREPIDETFDRYAKPMRLSTIRARDLGFVPRFDVEAGVRQAMGVEIDR